VRGASRTRQPTRRPPVASPVWLRPRSRSAMRAPSARRSARWRERLTAVPKVSALRTLLLPPPMPRSASVANASPNGGGCDTGWEANRVGTGSRRPLWESRRARAAENGRVGSFLASRGRRRSTQLPVMRRFVPETAGAACWAMVIVQAVEQRNVSGDHRRSGRR
jgi:hypothetical protein